MRLETLLRVHSQFQVDNNTTLIFETVKRAHNLFRIASKYTPYETSLDLSDCVNNVPSPESIGLV